MRRQMGHDSRGPSWALAFVLPNLVHPLVYDDTVASASTAFEQETIAIVSPRDSRIAEIRATFRDADVLFSSFRSELGSAFEPCALIVKKPIPPNLQKNFREGVVGFRNSVAMACVLFSRARMVAGSSNPHPTWSDTFEFYPTTLDAGRLVTISPALTALGIRVDHFQAMSSPHLPREHGLGQPDLYLARVLGEVWRRRFIDGIDDEFSRLLFRSLESAYRASSIANQNQSSLYDYGAQLGEWVTALEILGQHGRAGDVNQHEVRDLVGQYHWSSHRLQTKRFWLFNAKGLLTKEVKLNAAQALTNRLYVARHKFIHGAPVNYQLMVPRLGQGRPALPRAAAMVYRAALGAYLERQYPRMRFKVMKDMGHNEGVWEVVSRTEYDAAVLALISPRRPW
jgi:hypothetical protein